MANLRNEFNTIDGIELDEVPMDHSETAGLPISEVSIGDESLRSEQPVTTNLKILHCPSCLITFSERTRSYFDNHIKICGKGTFPCFLCSKKFCSKTVLKRHLNSHLRIKVFCCITCSSEFSTQFALKQHVEKVHDSGKSEINACKYCGKEYKWASSLSRHIVEKHCSDDSSNTPMAFPCVCGQMFSSYYCSYKHKKSCDAYSKNIEENNIKVKQFPVSTKFGCDFVNQNLSMSGLQSKTVAETGEMVASEASAHQSEVKIEMTEDDDNMHTNQVDIHKCQLCNEDFSERQDLEDHVDNCDPFDIDIGQDCLYAKMGIKSQSKTCVNGKEKELGIKNDAGESRNEEDMYDSFDKIERLDTKDTDFVGKRQYKDDTVIAVRTKLKTKLKYFAGFETDLCTQTSKDVSTPIIMVKTEDGNVYQENDKDADELYGDNGDVSEMTGKKGRNLSKSAMFYCPVCYTEDENVKSMHDHIKEHKADQLVWSVLSKKYAQMNGVNIDPASLVNDTQTVCMYCKADCQSTEELKLHLNRTHASLPFCCGICRLAYSNKELLKLHMRQYHLKTKLCVICKKTFLNNKDLKSHIRLIHETIQDLKDEIKKRKIVSRPEIGEKINTHVRNVLKTHLLIKQTVETEDGENTIYTKDDVENADDSGSEGESMVKINVKEVICYAPPIIKSAVVISKTDGIESGAQAMEDWKIEIIKVTNRQSNAISRKHCRTEVEYNSVEDIDDDVMDGEVTIKQDTNGKLNKKQFNRTNTKTIVKRIHDNDSSHIRFDFSGIKDSDFRCSFEQCGLLLSNYMTWKSHLSTHTLVGKGSLPIKCIECKYSTKSKRILKEHLLIKHNLLKAVEVGLKHCQFVKRGTDATVKVIACVFCGFMMDMDHFSMDHQCFRIKLHFFCPFCRKKNVDFELLQGHIKTEHTHETIHGTVRTEQYETLRTCQRDPAYDINSNDVNCHMCQIEFSSNKELKVHANEKHAICPYSCGVCRLCYGRLSGVVDHMRKTHSLPMKCRHCSRSFGDKPDLTRHEAAHLKTKPYMCNICTCSYADQRALVVHFAQKHPKKLNDVYSRPRNKRSSDEESELDMYMCDLCGLCYESRVEYKTHVSNHISQVDENVPVIKCELCSNMFTKNKYKRHMCTNEIKGNEHMKIEGYVDNEQSVKDLFKKIKQNVTPGLGTKVKCGLCGKQFNKTKYLYGHIRSTHIPDEGRRLHCPICGNGFSRKMELRIHMRTHSDSKPYQCRICLKSYRQLAHIREHLLSHSGKPNFSCKMCPQVFKTRNALARHTRIHCNVFPFECWIKTCDKKFSDLQNFVVHFRKCASRQNTQECFVCKLCCKEVKGLKDSLIHMKSHRQDELYKCDSCGEGFISFAKLYKHKVEQSHLTTEEQAGATTTGATNNISRSQSFKCIEVSKNVDLDILQQQFDYTPDVMSDEIMDDYQNDSKPEGKREYSDDEAVVEDVGDADMLMGIAEQLTHTSSKRLLNEEQYEVTAVEHAVRVDETPQYHIDLSPVATSFVTTSEGQGHLSQINTQDQLHWRWQTDHGECSRIHTLKEVVVEDDILLPGAHNNDNNRWRQLEKSNEKSPVNGQHGMQRTLNQNGNTLLVTRLLDNFRENVVSSPSVHAENTFGVATSSPIRRRVENTLKQNCNGSKLTQEYFEQVNRVYEINESANITNTETDNITTYISMDTIEIEAHEPSLNYQNTEGQYGESQGKGDIISEKVLKSSMILDEFGKEVRVNVMNESGYKTLIQSNPELLQTLLDTGKYTLNYTQSTSNIEECAQAASDLEEHTISVTSIEESTNISNEIDPINRECGFENEMNVEGTSTVYIADEVKMEDDASINISPNMKKAQLKTRNFENIQQVMNVDKVHGEITDKEANVGNQKNSEGHVNYKVSLNYYEDRTNQKELYPLQCDMCKRRYKRNKDLNLHKRTHLPNDQKPFHCRDCGRGFTTRHAFKNHLLLHSGERPYECVQCKKRFRQLGHLQTHLRQHANYRPFKCLHCDRAFLTNSHLTKHVLTHKQSACTKDGIPCLICGDVFVNEKQANLHQIKHLSADTQKMILNKFNLLKGKEDLEQTEDGDNDHISVVKKDQQGSHMCDVCGKIFGRSVELRIHREVHESGPKVTCTDCGKEFLTENRLKTHTTKNHSAQSWQCDMCGIQLKSKSGWYSHKRSHKKPQFQCTHCKKFFTRKDAFFYHFSSCIGEDFIQKLRA